MEAKQMFASLHTKQPVVQADAEISYAGYKRVPVQYFEDIGRQKSVTIEFPEIKETVEGLAFTHIAIGPEETGAGEVLRIIECIPNIKIVKGIAPKVVIANIPEPLPENLNPITAVVWHLVNAREMDPADLHPKLFEVINISLQEVGLPVLQVKRTSKYDFKVDMSQLKLS